MASSLSAISAYSRFYERSIPSSWQHRFPSMLAAERTYPKAIKATAQGKDNLDRLQRAPQPKKKVAQVAPTGLWDRFPTARTVQQMMDTMERMLDDPLAYGSTWPVVPARERNGYSRGRTPWEIKERAEDYKMRFDMPGMRKGDVKVWIEENMLVVKAEKVAKLNKEGQERAEGENGEEEEEWPAGSFGKYSSRIALPENVEFEKIIAEVKDGVLYITVPKSSASGKVIGINVQ